MMTETKILCKYLENKGIFVMENTADKLYRQFSEETYSARWMSFLEEDGVEYDVLNRFVAWCDEHGVY